MNTEKGSAIEKMILENEKKCLEKMKQDPAYDKSGTDTVYFYFYTNMCFHIGQIYEQEADKHFTVFCVFVDAAGLYCSRNWDGWLCWDYTPAGTYASQNCPDYFADFDPTGEQADLKAFAYLFYHLMIKSTPILC